MDLSNLKLRNKLNYDKPACCNVVWIVVELSAKPQDLDVLLQEEKQRIPKIQIAINTTFFIS